MISFRCAAWRALLLAPFLAACLAQAQVSVTLVDPAANATFPAGGAVPFSVSVTPSPGATTSQVQYFDGSTLIGQSLTAPFSITWSGAALGSHTVQATATDSSSASGSSAAVQIWVWPGLPYTNDFEAADGFSVAALGGQEGWTVSQGDAEIVTGGDYSGSQHLVLMPGSPVAIASEGLAGTTSDTVVYADFFAKPAADLSVAASSVVDTGAARIGFLLSGNVAAVQDFAGDGTGSGTWQATTVPASFAVQSGGNQAVAWHRFTIREDYTTKKWDLYVDGQMVAYDVPFRDSTATVFNQFAVSGHSQAQAAFDDLYIGGSNPLFTNASNDGISDSWKAQYGLDSSSNDRSLAPSGNGVTVIQEYVTGANPLDFYSGRPVTTTSPGNSTQISYTYDASGRLTAANYGGLSAQTFGFDAAGNSTSSAAAVQPVVAWRAANSLPTDGSGQGADSATPASDAMPNLAKYAFGMAAATPAPASYPTVSLAQQAGISYLAITYQRSDPAPTDLTYAVEVSSDGVTWTSGGGATVNVSTVVSGGQATVVERDSTAISSPAYGRQIRLHVTRSSLP